jgi:hypothetical protein
MSSPVMRLLGRLTGETSRMKVMSELASQFQRLEVLCSWLEGPCARICDQLLGPSPGQAPWADHLEEAVRWLEATTAKQRQAMPSWRLYRCLPHLSGS